MNTAEVKKLIEEAIEANESLFLIDWKVTPDNKITILADGDNGLSIEEIVRISRHVEHNLDRETEDFSLEVSSPGIGSNLTLPRQYRKNIGRTLEITKTDGKTIEGTIKDANEEHVVLSWQEKEPKPVGKGKILVDKEAAISFEEIKRAIIKLNF